MRLREISAVLASNIHRLTFNHSSMGGGGVRKLLNFRGVIAAAREIGRTGTLKREVEAVLVIEAVSKSVHNEITVDNETYSRFQTAVEVLRTRANSLREALDDTLPEVDEHSLSIKLPPDLGLKELGKTVLDLEKLLTQSLVNQFVQGEISLVGFDQGSEWLDISLGSVVALHFFAGMVKLVYDARRKELEIEAKRELVKDLKIQTAAKAEFERALEAELTDYRQLRLSELLAENGVPEQEKELAERIKMSIKMLTSLISRGLEVHPSLISPAESLNLLPDPKKLIEALKQLPPKPETAETSETEKSS